MAGPFFDVLLPSLAGIGANVGGGALAGMVQAPQYALDLQAKQFELDKQRQLLPVDLQLKQAHAQYYLNARQQQKAAMDAYNQLLGGLKQNEKFLETPMGRALMILAAKQDPLALNALAYQRQAAGELSGAKTADIEAQSPEKIALLQERQVTEQERQASLASLKAERDAIKDKLNALTAELEALRQPKLDLAKQRVKTEEERTAERQTQQSKEQAQAAEHRAKAEQTTALTQPKVQTEKSRARELGAREEQTRALTEPKVDVQRSLAEKNRALGAKAGQAPAAKETDKRNMEAYKAGLKEIAKDAKIIDTAAALEPDLRRWKELNARTETGRIVGRRPGILQPDFQELQAIENKLAINNFKPGQGAISNFERGLIKGGGPQTTNDPKTNDNITTIMLGAIQTLRERAEFRQWYLEQHGKLLGSDLEWNKYVEQHPRYLRDKQGGLLPNLKRMPWTVYFGAGATPPSAASPNVSSSALAPTNSKGWTLMRDKHGNQAYVSPDGTQFEEVR